MAIDLSKLLKLLIDQFPTQGLVAQAQIIRNGVASTTFEQARPTQVVQDAVQKIEQCMVEKWAQARQLEPGTEFPDPLLELLARHYFDRGGVFILFRRLLW
jgi:hypothetical protein